MSRRAGKIVRERREQAAERPVDAVSVKRESVPETPTPTPERSPVKTKEAYLSTERPSSDTLKQNAAPVKTKEAYAMRETPNAMPQTRMAVKERTAQVVEPSAFSDSAKPEIPKTPGMPVKTRETRIQNVGRPEPPLRSHDIPETAEAVQTERMPIKTKEAYTRRESASGAFRTQPTAPERSLYG